jgi:hypothetical protein
MKRVIAVCAASAAIGLAAVAPAARQAAPQTEAGFTSLFNGVDTTGWKVSGNPAAFTIVDGAIQANGAPNAAHIFYDGPVQNHAFTNFHLKLDVMAKNRSNGGIYICTEFQETGFPQKGFEIQLNNSHTDRVRTGSIYHVLDSTYIPAKDDEWFPMEIMVQGSVVTTTVKGRKTAEWTQPADWVTNYDHSARRIGPGTIAFQAHDPNSFTYYKNIRIKPL